MNGCPRCPEGMDRCPRCARRLCLEHQLLPGDACNDCELAYHESRGGLNRWAWFAVGFALPWLYVLANHAHLPSWSVRSGGPRAITTGVPMLDVLIMATVTAVFAGRAAVGIRERMHRRAFLANAS